MNEEVTATKDKKQKETRKEKLRKAKPSLWDETKTKKNIL
jgi:hypothetical protein